MDIELTVLYCCQIISLAPKCNMIETAVFGRSAMSLHTDG